MDYDEFVDACNTGSACPACFSTCSPFVKKVSDFAHPKFECLLCGHRFSGHEYVEHEVAA